MELELEDKQAMKPASVIYPSLPSYGSTLDQKDALKSFSEKPSQKDEEPLGQTESQVAGKIKELNASNLPTDISNQEPVLYWKRWLMLGLFCFLCIVNMYQWIHLNIIGNIVEKFYNESLPSNVHLRNATIDLLSMDYMVVFCILIIPCDWILVKKGLRWGCLLGAIFNALGAWLKCAAIAPDRFPLVMVGQVMCAIAGCFVPNVIPYMSSIWFGPNEVSTATAIGVVCFQLGTALGFLFPPMIVPNSDDPQVLEHGFTVMYYSTSAMATLVLLLIAVFFRKAPPTPPSRAQLFSAQIERHESYWVSMKKFLGNCNFMWLFTTFGINFGVFYAIGTLLNPMILAYFPGAQQSAGRIGLTMILAGIVGVIVVGLWLDRTKTFKSTCVLVNVLTMAFALAFAFTLPLKHIWIVYITTTGFGMFLTINIPVGFEFGNELSYPDSEATASAFLNTASCIFGIIFTFGIRPVMTAVSVVAANVIFAGFLFVGCVIALIIKPDYRRQSAEKKVVEQEINVEVDELNSIPSLDSKPQQ